MDNFCPVWGQGSCPATVSKDWKLVKLRSQPGSPATLLVEVWTCFLYSRREQSHSGLPAREQLVLVVSICLDQRRSRSSVALPPSCLVLQACPKLHYLNCSQKDCYRTRLRGNRVQGNTLLLRGGSKGILLLGEPCFSSSNEQIRDKSCWCPSILLGGRYSERISEGKCLVLCWDVKTVPGLGIRKKGMKNCI